MPTPQLREAIAKQSPETIAKLRQMLLDEGDFAATLNQPVALLYGALATAIIDESPGVCSQLIGAVMTLHAFDGGATVIELTRALSMGPRTGEGLNDALVREIAAAAVIVENELIAAAAETSASDGVPEGW